MGKWISTRNCELISPYVTWMAMMCVLPQTAWAYAARGALTAVMLIAFPIGVRGVGVSRRALLAGVAAGLGVFSVWIAPETLGLSVPAVSATPSPYSPDVCGWPLTLAKLAASAFVIPIAEELFFRRWLVEFAGFWWMVVLFAVEHGERWHVGAVTGVVYGLLAERFGLRAAIVAHMVTNFALGLYVIFGNKWYYW